MALIERLMGEPYVTHDQKIPVHDFHAAQVEVVAGRLTVAAIKSYLNMDSATSAEYDSLVAKVPGNASARLDYLNSLHSVFILAESRYPGYDTPAAVRVKLGV